MVYAPGWRYGADVCRVAIHHRERRLRSDDGPRPEDLLLPPAVGVDLPAVGDRLRDRERAIPLPRIAPTGSPCVRSGRADSSVRRHCARDGTPLGAQGMGRLVAMGRAPDL